MRAMLRFSQLTTASGILVGTVNRRNVRKCDLCGSLVLLSDLGMHTAYHAVRNDLEGYRVHSGRCENQGDRIVSVSDDGVIEVTPT